MTRWFFLFFASLTLGAALLTYYSVGIEEPDKDVASVRSGSHGGGLSSGGYNAGK